MRVLRPLKFVLVASFVASLAACGGEDVGYGPKPDSGGTIVPEASSGSKLPGPGTSDPGAGAAACAPETDPSFCARLTKTCDSVTAANNCGTSRTVSCGTCAATETCTANVCVASGGGGGPTPTIDCKLTPKLCYGLIEYVKPKLPIGPDPVGPGGGWGPGGPGRPGPGPDPWIISTLSEMDKITAGSPVKSFDFKADSEAVLSSDKDIIMVSGDASYTFSPVTTITYNETDSLRVVSEGKAYTFRTDATAVVNGFTALQAGKEATSFTGKAAVTFKKEMGIQVFNIGAVGAAPANVHKDIGKELAH